MCVAFPQFISRMWLPGRQASFLALVGLLMLTFGAAAEPVNRRILAIYDSTFEAAPDATLIHSKAEMPLNHLGYILEYRDAAQALPDPGLGSDYAAVLTWFTYDVSRPSEYLSWARRISEQGVPIIIIGGIGAPTTSTYLPLINKLLAPIGIAYSTNFVEATSGTTILVKDAAAIGFEHSIESVLPAYPVIRRLADDAPVLLEVEAPKRERHVRSALVTAGRQGAFVAPGFALHVDAAHGRTQWIVNPFAIFRKVLDAEDFPVPDTTTVSGRRLYYSLVDGDGWNDDVAIGRYSNPPSIAAEVLARELIEPYPDLPSTVGMIASDIDPAFSDADRAATTARHLFTLPQVEVAARSATSPQVWSFYEHYRRSEEERLIEVPRHEEVVGGLLGTIGAAFGIVRLPSEIERNRTLYLSGTRGLPRAYLRDEFSLHNEIIGATEIANALAPAAKSATVYSWTGDAKPFEAAIRATRIAGLRNMGGGDIRFDPEFPSITDVPPIARHIGTERQIYVRGTVSGNAASEQVNGIIGLAKSRALEEATDSPLRLAGVSLHYAAAAVSLLSSLNALRDHLNWARSAALAPITASQYAAIADGFFSARLERIGTASWRVSARDGLQTVRFDDAGNRSVDIPASVGVVGSKHHEGSLYVALDAEIPEAVVTLRPPDSGLGQGESTAKRLAAAQLDEARWMVRGVHRENCRLTFSADGIGAASFTWKDIGPGTYQVAANSGPDAVWRGVRSVGTDSSMHFGLPDIGKGRLEFTVSCARQSPEKWT